MDLPSSPEVGPTNSGSGGDPSSQDENPIPVDTDPFSVLHNISLFTQSNSVAIGQLSEMLRTYAHISEQRHSVTGNTPATQGPKIREPRAYDGDRSNGQLDDHIRDVTNWINFYDRRGHWTSEREKVEMASTYLTGRMHRMYTLTHGSILTVTEYLIWLRETFKDNNEQSRLRDQWHACVQGDRPTMEYAQDLIYLAARIQPEKAASEIKEHFRTGLDDAIQIGMAEHPEWDDLALFEYIKCADRQQQVETAKASVRKRVGQRGTGRILALSGTPRRGDTRKPAHFTMAHTTAVPSKGTKEWRDWCRKNAACFGCGSTDHQLRSCTKSAPTTRKGPPYRGRGGFGARQLQQGREVRKPQPQWKNKGKPDGSGRLRAIAGPYTGQQELQVDGGVQQTIRSTTQQQNQKVERLESLNHNGKTKENRTVPEGCELLRDLTPVSRNYR